MNRDFLAYIYIYIWIHEHFIPRILNVWFQLQQVLVCENEKHLQIRFEYELYKTSKLPPTRPNESRPVTADEEPILEC